MATASEAQQQPVVLHESVAAKIVRFLGRTPLYMLIVFLGVLWLVPTLGLFLTSVLDSTVIGRTGWWACTPPVRPASSTPSTPART